MSPHRTSPLNILHRLRHRELRHCPLGTSVSFVRSLYECLAPRAVAHRVEPSEDQVCKFVSHGEYLVCFCNMLRDIAVYRYTGLQDCHHGADVPPVPSGLPFSRFFQLAYRRTLAQGVEAMNKDFCLVTPGDEYLIVASATPPGSSLSEAFPEGSPVQNVPVYASTTFHLMRLEDGSACDQYTIANDCVHLSSNNGVYLYQDLLAILAIHGQTVHLLQILPGGRLVKVHQFGKLCWDDDELVLSEQAHAEDRWRMANGLDGLSSAAAGEPEQRAPSTNVQREAGLQLAVRNNAQPPAAAAAELQPAQAPLQVPTAAAVADFERAGSAVADLQLQVRVRPHSLISGITHSILAYLFLERHGRNVAADALRRFFFYFDAYAALVMWKAQFLDRHRLLISVGPSNATQARSSNAHFLVVYDRQSGRVVEFHDNKSESLLKLYLQHTACFHAACMSTPWARYLTPCAASLHMPASAEPSAASAPQAQMIRRLLANLPTTAQALCPSPFLDANLFLYDDKLISPVLRMRAYVEQPLKFSSRAHPAACRFKVQPHGGSSAAQPGRPVKQLVGYHFHPVLPLVLCVLHTALQPPQLTIYFRQ